MAKFKPGESGNPDGRPKGSKNKITLLKESMELLLREEASPEDLRGVMRQALTLALQGDRSMIKLILDLHMSKGTTQDAGKAAEKVQINVTGLQPMEIKKETTVPLDEVALLVATNDEESKMSANKQSSDHMNSGIGLVSKPDKGLNDPKAPTLTGGTAPKGVVTSKQGQ